MRVCFYFGQREVIVEIITVNEKALTKRPIKNVSIYLLKDPETQEVRYIGKTKVSLEKRLHEHSRERITTYKGRWVESLKNKGLKPLIECVERCTDDNWQEREMFWIQHYKDLGARLTNGNEGGLGCHQVSDETRAKLSFAAKNISDETRIKRSNSNKGKTLSPETRAKIGAASKGRFYTLETRAKMSELAKNRIRKPLSDDGRARIVEAQKNRVRKPMSAESRARMSELHKNRIRKPFSAESRAKMSEAQKKRYKISASNLYPDLAL
jgi:hypothetical protein